MIISHKYKYLFVQLPRSGSTSIGKELCEYYDGEQILYKHSPYHEFLRIANQQEKEYFVFSCIRNPLDEVVSRYVQMKDDNWGVYRDPRYWKRNGGGGWVPDYQLKQFADIENNNLDFAAFFKKYYKLTYENWSCLDHENFDFLIRFENLASDFAQALQLIGIEPKRSIPVYHKTKNKKANAFLEEYTPEIHNQAKEIFGPFMKRWNYEFPEAWGDKSFPWYRQLEYNLLGIPREFYWRYWKRNRGHGIPQFLLNLKNKNRKLSNNKT